MNRRTLGIAWSMLMVGACTADDDAGAGNETAMVEDTGLAADGLESTASGSTASAGLSSELDDVGLGTTGTGTGTGSSTSGTDGSSSSVTTVSDTTGAMSSSSETSVDSQSDGEVDGTDTDSGDHESGSNAETESGADEHGDEDSWEEGDEGNTGAQTASGDGGESTEETTTLDSDGGGEATSDSGAETTGSGGDEAADDATTSTSDAGEASGSHESDASETSDDDDDDGGTEDLDCGVAQVACEGSCIDPRTDSEHCGARLDCLADNAGVRCGEDQVCIDAECRPNCASGLVACDGRCIDPMTDAEHCGADPRCLTGRRCRPVVEQCVQGACEAAQCEAPAYDYEYTPPNIMLVIDKSGSMNQPWDPSEPEVSRYRWVRQMVADLLVRYEGRVSFGLELMPSITADDGEHACRVDAGVDVEFVDDVTQDLPPDLLGAMPDPNQSVHGATPGGTALEQAVEYVTRFSGNPHATHLFMIVDGDMSTDPENPPVCEDEGRVTAAARRAAEHGIGVHAIGLGDEVGQATLEAIAAAGGTGQPLVPESSEDLFALVDELRMRERDCNLRLSRAPRDHRQVAVVDGDGRVYPFFRANREVHDCESAQAAGMRDGWVWRDRGDAPTEMQLCGRACADFSQGGELDVHYACD